MLKKMASGVLNEAGKYVSYRQHKETLGWIKGMVTFLMVPKGSLLTHIDKPANHEAFQTKAKTMGADLEMQWKIWNRLVWKAYIGFGLMWVSMGIMIFHFNLIVTMGSIGFIAISISVWFNGSLLAYQMQNQQLDGIREFFLTPSQWFPDPFQFKPLLAKKRS